MSVNSSPPPDPTLPVAERQLAMLGEVAQIAMVLSRAYGAAAIAAANAVEVILDDEYYQPETGRARALAGAKDAAEGFRKVSRSLRLTLALEMKTAETLRDLQAGIVTHSGAREKDAGETPAVLAGAVDLDRRRPAGPLLATALRISTSRSGTSSGSTMSSGPTACPRVHSARWWTPSAVDIGVAPDWKNWRIGRPKPEYAPLKARPPGWSECRPPGAVAEGEHPPPAA